MCLTALGDAAETGSYSLDSPGVAPAADPETPLQPPWCPALMCSREIWEPLPCLWCYGSSLATLAKEDRTFQSAFLPWCTAVHGGCFMTGTWPGLTVEEGPLGMVLSLGKPGDRGQKRPGLIPQVLSVSSSRASAKQPGPRQLESAL